MSDSSMAVLKALRERTGAGIVACRNALTEARGDAERAADLLRAQESRVAQAKVQRIATQGMVGTRVAASRAVMLEVNCESDFVARSAPFVSGVSECLAIALDDGSDEEALVHHPRIVAVLTSVSARTGERIVLRRARIVRFAPDHVVAAYVHGGDGRDVGRIGVVVEAAFPRSSESETLAHGVAMHIAASAPLWVTASDIPGAVLDARRAEFAAEAARAGKPAAIVERIVEGRVDKYIAQSTLMGQPYALNPDERVGDVLRDAGQGWRCTLAVRQYVRFQVGETEPAEV